MDKVKKTAGRLAAFSAAIGLTSAALASAIVPTMTAADALNPLTQRTLLLSSSSPGWDYTDGSGNGTYAPPGSGANGQKTGETFSFNVSTNSTNSGLNATNTPIKAFTLQYCTTPAGKCSGPGDDAAASTPGTDDASHSDLNVVTSSPVEGTAFEVKVAGVAQSGWSMTASNVEDGNVGTTTGKNNFITLTNSTGIQPAAGTHIELDIIGTSTNYITNPGSDAFFVKINDYSSNVYQNFRPGYPDSGHAGQDVVDGGVTVANVMNQSIELQTKVLETMDFSVGTVDPDTVSEASLGQSHGQCDTILPRAPGSSNAANTLALGNSSAEDSLSTATAYDTTSYWRLSSNSSNGATVYYSGATLHNTEGDAIAPLTDDNSGSGHTPGVNAAVFAHTGTEQFGLGINSDTDTLDAAFSSEVTSHASDNPDYWHNPTLSPLTPTASYGSASGTLANGSGPKFAFNPSANTIPVPIASENTQVVNCATGKMRYVADIAATTPAGIYTTKINYVAAPEY